MGSTPPSSSSSSSSTLQAIPDGASLVSEFEPADRSQWRAKLEATKPGTADRLDKVSEDGLPLAALYTAADGSVASPTPWPRAPSVGRLHTHGDVETVGRAVVRDAGRGVQTAWVRLSASLRAGCRVPCGSAGLAGNVTGLARLNAPQQAVFIEAGAAASGLLRALSDGHGLTAVLADPIGVLAETGVGELPVPEALLRLAQDTRWAIDRRPEVATVLLSGTPYHDAGATDAQELGITLATGIEVLGALQRAGVSPADAVARTVVLLSVGHQPFMALAKLRAARRLWTRVSQHWGAGAVAPRLWVQSSARTRTRREVANNLLRATLEAFAAAAGGADGALVLAHTHALSPNDDDAVRLAINTQLLMRDESGLCRVADPGGGSWSIEAQTDALARAAWTIAQQLRRDGGVAAALASGALQSEVRASAAKRAEAVAQRRVPITGVTIFPDAEESAPPRPVEVVRPAAMGLAPGVEVEPLPPQHLSEPIEGLRDAAQGAQPRPMAALVRLGPALAVRPQVDFAAAVMTAGGIEVEAIGPDLDDVVWSRFRVVVLCGDAEQISESGGARATAAKAAGIAWVVLAGRPGADQAELRAAGVDDFVHRGVDIVALVARAHAAMSIGGAA